MSKTILYKCTECQGEQDVKDTTHKSAWFYIECDCGEKMMPANQSDLETMDIYDERD